MTYDDIRKELFNNQDLKYRDFNAKIVGCANLIGVRTPILKEIAKQIAKGDYKSFLNNNKHMYYEETLLYGLLLGYIKLDFDELKTYIDNFLPLIDNWAICDITAANLKVFKKIKYRETCFNEIIGYLNSDNYWINRFGYVLLIDYFIDDEHIDIIFNLCSKYKDEYYIKMAVAWLISICYIKYKDKTLEFLNKNILDDWTYNKAIQKIIESNRVDIKDKNILRKMKHKI